MKSMLEKIMQAKVLVPANKEEILKLERDKLSELEEIESRILEWKASWREEFLDYYLEKGWSYGIFQEEKLSSYFLAQPLLFLQGQMQSLWLEHLCFQNDKERDYLLEIAYRTSKEKHLQKLLFKKEIVEDFQLVDHPYTGERKDFFSQATSKTNGD